MTIRPEDLAALRYLNDLYERHCRPYLTHRAPSAPTGKVEQTPSNRKEIAMPRSPEDTPTNAQQSPDTGMTAPAAPDGPRGYLCPEGRAALTRSGRIVAEIRANATPHAPPPPSPQQSAMTRSPEDVPAATQQSAGTGTTSAPATRSTGRSR